MTEPTPPSDMRTPGLPPMPVPPPRKAGRDPDVRPTQVLLGMLLGAGVFFGGGAAMGALAWAITSLLGEPASASMALGIVIWLVPVAVLVWAILRAARTGRKGLAIGMALFAGLAVLLAVACVGLVFSLR